MQLPTGGEYTFSNLMEYPSMISQMGDYNILIVMYYTAYDFRTSIL